jgi:hypothetical protein
MAYEDAWKASNTDFRTPFASIEDAITRCVDLDPPPPVVCATSLRHRRRCRQRRVRRSRLRTKTPGIRAPFSSIEDGARCVDVDPPPRLVVHVFSACRCLWCSRIFPGLSGPLFLGSCLTPLGEHDRD